MRLPDLQESELNEDQLKVWRNIAGGPRGGVRGPFAMMLRRPALTDCVQKLGEYCRFGSSLSERISEFAIIITARHWSSEVEWRGHSQFALNNGLGADVIEDIRWGRRPGNMKEDEAAAYQFCTELHHNKEVSDATYAQALKLFGEGGVLDLCAVSGYYALVAMVLKTGQKPLVGSPPQLPGLVPGK